MEGTWGTKARRRGIIVLVGVILLFSAYGCSRVRRIPEGRAAAVPNPSNTGSSISATWETCPEPIGTNDKITPLQLMPSVNSFHSTVFPTGHPVPMAVRLVYTGRPGGPPGEFAPIYLQPYVIRITIYAGDGVAAPVLRGELSGGPTEFRLLYDCATAFFTWDQKDLDGRQVQTGNYWFDADLTAANARTYATYQIGSAYSSTGFVIGN